MRRLLLLCSLAAACFSEPTSMAECVGASGCECYGNGTCDAGLECYMGERCVDPACVAGTRDCPCDGMTCDAGLICEVICKDPDAGTSADSNASMPDTMSTLEGTASSLTATDAVTTDMPGTTEMPTSDVDTSDTMTTGAPLSCSECAAAVTADGTACGDQLNACELFPAGCQELADCWLGGGPNCCNLEVNGLSPQLTTLLDCVRMACGPECGTEPPWLCEAGSAVCTSCVDQAALVTCNSQYDCMDCPTAAIDCSIMMGENCCNMGDPSLVDAFMQCASEAGCGPTCTDALDCQD